MDEKLNKQLVRIAKALENKGYFTMSQKVLDAVAEIEDKERELDNLYRDMAGASA